MQKARTMSLLAQSCLPLVGARGDRPPCSRSEVSAARLRRERPGSSAPGQPKKPTKNISGDRPWIDGVLTRPRQRSWGQQPYFERLIGEAPVTTYSMGQPILGSDGPRWVTRGDGHAFPQAMDPVHLRQLRAVGQANRSTRHFSGVIASTIIRWPAGILLPYP